MTGTDAFDAEAVLNAFGGDREIVVEMLALVAKHVPVHAAAIEAALAAGDLASAARAAHSLRGAVSNVEPVGICELTLAVETACKAGEPAAARAAASKLSSAVARLVPELNAWARQLEAVAANGA